MCNLFTLLSLILSLKLYKRATFNEKPSYEATMVNKLFPMAKKTISIVQCLSKQPVSLSVICTREKKGTNGVAMSVYRQASRTVVYWPRLEVSKYRDNSRSSELGGTQIEKQQTAQLAVQPPRRDSTVATPLVSLVILEEVIARSTTE